MPAYGNKQSQKDLRALIRQIILWGLIGFFVTFLWISVIDPGGEHVFSRSGQYFPYIVRLFFQSAALYSALCADTLFTTAMYDRHHTPLSAFILAGSLLLMTFYVQQESYAVTLAAAWIWFLVVFIRNLQLHRKKAGNSESSAAEEPHKSPASRIACFFVLAGFTGIYGISLCAEHRLTPGDLIDFFTEDNQDILPEAQETNRRLIKALVSYYSMDTELEMLGESLGSSSGNAPVQILKSNVTDGYKETPYDITTFSYDDHSCLKEAVSRSGKYRQTIQYQYDADRFPKTEIISGNDVFTRTYQNHYRNGMLVSCRIPYGKKNHHAYLFYRQGKLIKIDHYEDQACFFYIFYDGNRVSEIMRYSTSSYSHGNRSYHLHYDKEGKLSRIIESANNNPVITWNLFYDNAGNLIEQRSGMKDFVWKYNET